ncbi:MFS transporter [Deinococcus frigens]
MLAWWAGLISWIGNGAMFIALPVYVYSRTDSTVATALSVMTGAFATTVLGQVAGVFVDRWHHRRTLIWVNLALAVVTLAFLIGLNLPWWTILPVALAQAALSQFLGPAENALLPTLVGEHLLPAANSLNALNNNLARLIGPALGGVLVARSGFAGVVIMDALSFVLAAGLLLLMRVEDGPHQPATTRQPGAFGQEWLAGLRAVQGQPLLMLSFGLAALVGFGEGFISALMAPWVSTTLRGGGLELGYLMSVQAVGGVLAGALLATFAGRFSTVKLLGWSALLSGLLLAVIFNYALVYPILWPALVLTALAGLPFTAWGTAQMLNLQQESVPEVRGRVFGSYFALFGGAQFLGMAVSGVLGDRLGVQIINVDAMTYLLAGVVALTAVGRYGRKHLVSPQPD